MYMSAFFNTEGIFTTICQVYLHSRVCLRQCGLGLPLTTHQSRLVRSSIRTCILQPKPVVYVMGYPCHILCNTNENAGGTGEDVKYLCRFMFNILPCFLSSLDEIGFYGNHELQELLFVHKLPWSVFYIATMQPGTVYVIALTISLCRPYHFPFQNVSFSVSQN